MKKSNPDFFAHFPYENSRIMPRVNTIAQELSADEYSQKVQFSEFALRAYQSSSFGFEHAIEQQQRYNAAKKVKPILPTFADTVTLISLGLGLWWAAGGPVWAGLLSIIGDELDGRIARAMGTQSERGSLLDWGSDIALTSASLVRLGANTRHMPMAIIAAPIFLLAQAHLREEGYRPPVGSARAVIMLSTMVIGKR